jgi:polyisoprenoid-binding protein YceI
MVSGRGLFVVLVVMGCTALLFPKHSVASEKVFSFRIDPAKSFIRLKGETTLHGLEGEAKKFSGEGTAPESLHGTGVSARVVIQAESIETGNFLRDAVMRSSALEVEKHPEIVFHVDGVIAEGKNPAQGDVMKLTLKGRLDLHGVVKEKTFLVTVKRGKEGFSVSGTFPISLSEHEIPDPSLFFNKVKDEFIASFEFTAVPVSNP